MRSDWVVCCCDCLPCKTWGEKEGDGCKECELGNFKGYKKNELCYQPVEDDYPEPHSPGVGRESNKEGSGGVMSKGEDFLKKMETLINVYSMENESNTPDFILAEFMHRCLTAANTMIQQRETWYGRDPRPTSNEIKLPNPSGGGR